MQSKVEAKLINLEESKAKLLETQKKVEEALKLVSDKEREVEAANEILRSYQKENSDFKHEKKQEIAEIDQSNDNLKLIIEKLKEQQSEIQEQFDNEMNEKTQEEEEMLSNINSIKDDIKRLKEGKDGDRIDIALHNQISSIRKESEEYMEQTKQIQTELNLKKEDIEILEKQIQIQTLKMDPTPELLINPKFIEKQILLEELLVQNVDLQNEINALRSKITRIKMETHILKTNIDE